MTSPIIPFNPLDRKNLGASVAEALLSQDAVTLSALTEFKGAGIYALYYTGKFPAYATIAEGNSKERFAIPIYIGKAVPPGSRKGIEPSSGTTRVLYSRLAEHRDSINLAKNLEIRDFYCRFLVTEDIWIPLGEALLISRFTPIWNSIIDGFGNHDPGKGRYEGMCPRWDVLHPGRGWATKCKQRPETADEINREIIAFLKSKPAIQSQKFIKAD